ncbi:hypothetical protein SAMN05444487_11748 [Marininema mesophilum]|uniref:Uncharacterized protein n=1 Tax=Marininema mesophilum TaxID=1048340 RepID=A0A1H3BMY9_9BACL|nr:hypothetical protein [Marininema mesophilum]SDX42714.1 hypothetical protein SAMN05444487_11748 [Marininema mesophilum]
MNRKFPFKKEKLSVTRAFENADDLDYFPYVARLHYEDEDCVFDMCLTAQEADIYQNARTQYEKMKIEHPDPQVHRHYIAQKFISLHEHFEEQIRMYYGLRDNDSQALENAREYCRLQIEYGAITIRAYRRDPFFTGELPRHVGYETLLAIYEESGALKEAFALIDRVKNEGWLGNWVDRERRLEEKLHGYEGGEIA